MKQIFLAIMFAFSTPAWAAQTELSAADLDRMRAADVVLLGEVHDNPTHHMVQANAVAALDPTALVIEMLSAKEAHDLQADKAGFAARWEAASWPDYAMYLPIFTAHDGPILGAGVSREVARATYADGVSAHFTGDAAAYGLDQPLPADQHAARLDLQYAAHCEAMPREALGGMIEVQRLRDATLAAKVIEALDSHGGPVVVITGNGHARKDWGVPAYLARLRPSLKLVAVGQAEAGVLPEGGFDIYLDAPAVDRPDPCAAFE
ncbi:ChaN family lipoprotein [Aliiroseovarius marinus]|uniref:ChaN family lipoprotein n=1 Tax=Aliiroseovarius marinus TaxID=2500159 RepID=UPI003D7DFFE7